MPTIADLRAARERIGDGIVVTPVVPALALRDRLPCALHIKLENAQRTGSFKDRGALNRLLDLSDEERRRGVRPGAPPAGDSPIPPATHRPRPT